MFYIQNSTCPTRWTAYDITEVKSFKSNISVGPDKNHYIFHSSDKMPSISQCQLEVDLSSLVFEHHHLFSLEHYLTTKVGD